MYYYTIRSQTGELIAEGTAAELVSRGLFSSREAVRTSYNCWRRRVERGLRTNKEWVRTGAPGSSAKGPARSERSRRAAHLAAAGRQGRQAVGHCESLSAAQEGLYQ